MAGADRATNATYEITSSSGTTAVAVNQRQFGGVWVLLGSYSLSPGQGHNVRLTDNANGLVVADAVKFIPVGASSDYAVHTDHLNTPRLVVDYNQVAVWRWDQVDPFGNNVANQDPDGNLITFEFPVRFPGQYFDKETNLHYNYFRDYDPSIGRYVESDPIGLQGGINTYSYARANPLRLVDPTGLWGIGVIVGGTAEAGFGGGAAYQAASGAGVFFNTPMDRWNVGTFSQSGGFAGDAQSAGPGIPGGQFVYGATGGLGGGAFFTNATSAQQLLGPFDTWSLNLPFISAQFATDGRINVGSISFGRSYGFSFSRYTVTTTNACCVGWGCR